jgi:hypothetical protein
MYKGDLLRMDIACKNGNDAKFCQLLPRLYITCAMRHNYRLYNVTKIDQVEQLSNMNPSIRFINFQRDNRIELDELMAHNFKMTMAECHCHYTRGN